MDYENTLVDINIASQVELLSLPGVGPALVERIMAARPFISPEDLRRVNGIGVMALERLLPFVAVVTNPEVSPSAVQEPEPVQSQELNSVQESNLEETVDVPQTEINPSDVSSTEFAHVEATEVYPLPAAAEGSPIPAEPVSQTNALPLFGPAPLPTSQRSSATRAEAFWISVASSAVGSLLTVVCILGLLYLINGSLNFASAAKFETLSRQVSGVNSQLGVVQQDVSDLSNRLAALEGLGGRLIQVEKTTKQLNDDLQKHQNRLDAIDQQVNEISTEINEIRAKSNLFQSFLDKLKSLLASLPLP